MNAWDTLSALVRKSAINRAIRLLAWEWEGQWELWMKYWQSISTTCQKLRSHDVTLCRAKCSIFSCFVEQSQKLTHHNHLDWEITGLVVHGWVGTTESAKSIETRILEWKGVGVGGVEAVEGVTPGVEGKLASWLVLCYRIQPYHQHTGILPPDKTHTSTT